MSALQIILAIVAFSFIFALFVAAVFGRLNGDDVQIVDKEPEPLGDMADIRRVINDYED